MLFFAHFEESGLESKINMTKISIEFTRVIVFLSKMGLLMISSCPMVSKRMITLGYVAENYENPYIFHTKPSFGKVKISTLLIGFRCSYLASPFLIECITR